jgi:hypothetical protein
MLSRAQQILVKRAQREAGLSDADYRDALGVVSGCRSTTDPRMTDRHCDLALAYFEAILWHAVDAGALQPSCKPDAVFKQRGYWAQKNTHQETSRDRYAASSVSRQIADLESALGGLGFGAGYCASIRAKVTEGRADARSLHAYRAALQRTLRAKQHKFADAVSANNSKQSLTATTERQT